MKKKLLLLMIVFLSIPCALLANADSFTQGEWAAIPEHYKMEFVKAALDDLRVLDVPFTGKPEQYLIEVEKLYAKSAPSLQITVSEVMPALVYHKEPDTRKSIDTLIKKKRLDKLDPSLL